MPEIVRYSLADSYVELREAEDGKSGRTITGLAVPYGERAEIAPGVFERIMPGAFEGSNHVVLRSEHGTTIGPVTWKDTAKGIEIEARISNTQAGDEALTLLRDGVLDRLSIGFLPSENGTQVEEDGTLVRTKGRLFEVSLTGTPAYQGAKVLALREAGQPAEEGTEMPTDTKLADLETQVVQLREVNEDLQRRMAAFSFDKTPKAPIGAQFRSGGEWLKAVADPRTREEALKVAVETRAFNGTTLGDTLMTGADAIPTWLADQVRLVSENSVALEAFGLGALPAQGMQLEYLTFGDSTIQVQEQVAEGDVLAFGKLSLDTSATGIRTYGGYSSFSFQALQRSPINVVDTSYALLTAQAARRSNLAFVSALTAANASYQSVTRAGDTIDNWIDAIVDAELALTGTGLAQPAQAILVSSDVFRSMLRVRDGDFRLMTIPGLTGNASQLGTADTAGPRGTVMGYPVAVEPALPAGSMYVYNRGAITTFGDRTPTRLGPDNDITNLTSEISVYFLQATAVQFPSSVVRVVTA